MQFEDDVKSNVEVSKTKVVEKVNKAPVRQTPVEVVEDNEIDDDTMSVDYSKDIKDLATYILDNKDTISNTIREMNVPLVKQYKTSINLEGTFAELCNVLSKVTNIKIFTNAVMKRHEKEKSEW